MLMIKRRKRYACAHEKKDPAVTEATLSRILAARFDRDVDVFQRHRKSLRVPEVRLHDSACPVC